MSVWVLTDYNLQLDLQHKERFTDTYLMSYQLAIGNWLWDFGTLMLSF